MNFTEIPFIAFEYITKGDPKDLTPEQIKTADEWVKGWEITSVEEYMENETLSHEITKSLINDMDFENHYYEDDFD